jgi:hypothetical protein
MFLVAGALLVIIGIPLSSAGIFVLDLLVLLVGLTGGAQRSHCHTVDQIREHPGTPEAGVSG